MQIVKKLSTVALAVVFMFGLVVQSRAATTPSLGAAATYGVLGSTYTNTAAGTTVNGDVGFTTGPAVASLGVHTYYGSGAPYATAGIDQASALSNLNSQPCNFNYGSATDLSLLSQPLVPGVYCVVGAASIGTGGITLNGSGTYIFRINGALTSVANSAVTLAGGATACDVFWTPTAATTLGANSTFVGTDIGDSGITMGSSVNWTGRSLAFGGTVTTDLDTITVPTCATPVVVPTPTSTPAPVVITPTPTSTPIVLPIPVVAPAPTPLAPPLPSSGIAPDQKSFPWNIVIPAGIVLAISTLFVVILRKRTI